MKQVCLSSVYLMSSLVTRSPRPSPAVFHTGSDQMLAWEWPGNEAIIATMQMVTSKVGKCKV